jgi:hypothetical protein
LGVESATPEAAEMSAFESVAELVKEWEPKSCATELKYRDSLASFLRDRLKDVKLETEYRHSGTTIDIYVQQQGFFSSSEVYIELKRNLQHKAQLDRLVGQVESLRPSHNSIVVILCGETNPALITRFREKYGLDKFRLNLAPPFMSLVVKEESNPAKKA